MSSVLAPSTTPLSVGAAKRKFFHCHDPYVKYHTTTKSSNKTKETNIPSKKGQCTIYGSAFSPLSRGHKRYFVACTSDGCIVVWDRQQTSHSQDLTSEKPGSKEPILRCEYLLALFCSRLYLPSNISQFSQLIYSVPVCSSESKPSSVLYDLQFVETSNGEHLLVVSGEPGVLIYSWAHFEAAIETIIDGSNGISPHKKPKCQDPIPPKSPNEITPITTFQAHPSPGGAVEINSASYDKSNNILFGAAGDAFGCYQWDMTTEQLVGTFRGGHRDYLHVVKTIPSVDGSSRYVLTGGEDGNLGWWDGKDRKLIEMMDMQSIMDKSKELITCDNAATAPSTTRGFMGTSTTLWNNSSNLWVSSMEANGNWLAVCGGAETNSTTSSGSSMMMASRSTNPSNNSGGFMSLFHLPTRTLTSGCITRENLNTVAYNTSLDCFVTGGNEGRVSFWESTSSMARSGRAWCTPPATYTIAIDDTEPNNGMIVGGSGGTLDCFVDRVKVSQLQV